MNGVRIALPSDRDAVAAMLARAFARDPAFNWLYAGPPPPVKLERLFRLIYDSDAPHLRLMTSGGQAATLWRAPGRAVTSLGETLRHALPLWRALGTKLPRAMRIGAAIEAHFPREPFWYLHIAGCDPAHQGKGHGGAAIRAGLERVAGRLPCYLETARESNVALYQRLGFRVTGDWHVPGGGPRFWSMLRRAD